jgi:hypothetical protein
LPSFCSAGVCTAPAPRAAVGDACPTGSCSGGELQCWAGVCHDPSDATRGAIGDACTPSGPNQCSVELTCPSSGGTCQATNLALGAPCLPSDPDPCALDAHCDGSACVALPSAGESCPTLMCASGFACRCPTDASCTFADYQCVAMHRLGESCTTNVSCWSGSCALGVCAAHDICD